MESNTAPATLSSWRSRLPVRALTGSEAVRYGRGLLLTTGFVVSIAMPLLEPTTQDLYVLGLVSAGMTAFLVGSLFLPWHRWSDRATVAFPVAVMVGLALVGHFTRTEIGTCFSGLFVLCFAYLGVCERRHTVFYVLPLAITCYLLSLGGWDAATGIRLCVAAAVWTLLAELLSHLMQQQQMVAEMLHAASRTDDLTRLANRRDLEQRLERTRVGDTLVMCDLDRFKQLNDTVGHAAGDVVLHDFGTVLRGCLRGDDYAARYGGEEFVLILAETDGAQSVEVLARLRRRWHDLHPEITFSAGYATSTGRFAPRQLLEAADQAMYTAKAAGRDCFRGTQSHAVA
jgi:diguanylate cyclase (GGDEF)-like protein